MGFTLVYITCISEEQAKGIAGKLLEERLIACANIFPIQSMYWWKDAIQSESEWVAIVKTTDQLWDALQKHVESLHTYEVPCIMKIKVEANAAYEEWIRDSVQPNP